MCVHFNLHLMLKYCGFGKNVELNRIHWIDYISFNFNLLIF